MLTRKKRKRILDFILHRLRIRQQQHVPYELQQAIDACETVEQLTNLLFSAGLLDEASIQAFDQRFAELEKTA